MASNTGQGGHGSDERLAALFTEMARIEDEADPKLRLISYRRAWARGGELRGIYMQSSDSPNGLTREVDARKVDAHISTTRSEAACTAKPRPARLAAGSPPGSCLIGAAAWLPGEVPARMRVLGQGKKCPLGARPRSHMSSAGPTPSQSSLPNESLQGLEGSRQCPPIMLGAHPIGDSPLWCM